MKCIVNAKYQEEKVKNLNEGGATNVFRVSEIDYNNDSTGDFVNFIDHLYNSVEGFIKRIQSANELRLGGNYYVVEGYSIVFLRDDGTVIDEVNINDETINSTKELITAFFTI